MTLTHPGLRAPGNTAALGAHPGETGTSFAIWAPRATRVELALISPNRATQTNVELTVDDDGVWSALVPGVKVGQLYGYRVHGEWNPATGSRFNPAKLLLDPYARAVTGGVDYSGPIMDHTPESNFMPDPADSLAFVPLSVVVEPTPPPTPIARRRPIEDCVIYEAHVGGYTRLHPAVPEHKRGTFAGLAYDKVIAHLKDLGVNAIELLPVQQFVSEPFIIGRGLTNYWGYNTLGFFAPHGAYCSVGTLGEQVTEFKDMVSALHEADIEVILDVVYNHTGEGGNEGPTLSFRGIDHLGYYRLTGDNRNDYDVTGCGNSVDTSEPGVMNLVLDSLRYWVLEMGVDGFRFDLATTLIRDSSHHVTQDHPFKLAIAADPILSQVKLISEPWDLGPYGYQVGRWGPDWSEWNDRFRGHVRDFWRGAVHGVQELATRLSGSPDVFGDGRRPGNSINFVTAHDGFTLRDLVTYNLKHNEANGENNRDGTDDNRSWNCGWEGDTDDDAVNALRRRQVKNLMATLLMSSGIPMLTAGDEFGRTQLGNNNAYCQDSPLSWVHWDTMSDWADVTELTATLLQLRSQHRVLRPLAHRHHDQVMDAEGQPLGRPDLAWLNGRDGEMTQDDWHDMARHTLGMYVSDAKEAFVTWVHGGEDPVDIVLPGLPWGQSYTLVAHTGEPGELPPPAEALLPGVTLRVPARTVLVLEAEVPLKAVRARAARSARTPAPTS